MQAQIEPYIYYRKDLTTQIDDSFNIIRYQWKMSDRTVIDDLRYVIDT